MPLLIETAEDRVKLLIGSLILEREALVVQLEKERAKQAEGPQGQGVAAEPQRE